MAECRFRESGFHLCPRFRRKHRPRLIQARAAASRCGCFGTTNIFAMETFLPRAVGSIVERKCRERDTCAVTRGGRFGDGVGVSDEAAVFFEGRVFSWITMSSMATCAKSIAIVRDIVPFAAQAPKAFSVDLPVFLREQLRGLLQSPLPIAA